jgi:hypothetical protein
VSWLGQFFSLLLETVGDVLPIAAIIFGFQYFVIRQPIANLRRVLFGFGYVLLGMTLFLMGLEKALFPIGKLMAQQLVSGAVTNSGEAAPATYFWIYAFAAAIGFSTTIAEPSLLAVAIKAEEISGKSLSAWGLRITVALGVAFGVALGSWRIVSGVPLYYFIVVGYVIVLVQTRYSQRSIIALAYDSGGVTTSTVTVPLVTALGLGLASTIPGRDPLVDGFGLIASAVLFPIMSVLGYAKASELLSRYSSANS